MKVFYGWVQKVGKNRTQLKDPQEMYKTGVGETVNILIVCTEPGVLYAYLNFTFKVD